MGTRVFLTTRNRPFHLGPYPLERLKRVDRMPDLSAVPDMPVLDFRRLETPHSLVNAMGEYQAMMDVIRDGLVNPTPSAAPVDPQERSNHMKAFGYFQDASNDGGLCVAGRGHAGRHQPVTRISTGLPRAFGLSRPRPSPRALDEIMAGLRESIEKPPNPIDGHTHVIVCLVEHLRPPRAEEPGAEWIMEAQDHRAALRATETAVILSNYLHLLGFRAKAHTATSSDVDLNRLAVASGLGVAGGRCCQSAVSGGWVWPRRGDHGYGDGPGQATGATVRAAQGIWPGGLARAPSKGR